MRFAVQREDDGLVGTLARPSDSPHVVQLAPTHPGATFHEANIIQRERPDVVVAVVPSVSLWYHWRAAASGGRL